MHDWSGDGIVVGEYKRAPGVGKGKRSLTDWRSAMAITENSIIQRGARVRIRRGPMPSDPTLVGRSGVVVLSSPYDPRKVEVALDGDPEIRSFAPAELEQVSGPEALPPDVEAARKRLSRP